MGELWESSEFKQKIKRLPAPMQRQFLDHVREMYDRESSMMLDFLEESRLQLHDTAEDIASEQGALRDTADRMALSRLSMYDRHAVEDLLNKRSHRNRNSSSRASSRTDSQMSTDSFSSSRVGSPGADSLAYELEGKLAVERYLKKRERGKQPPQTASPSTSPAPAPNTDSYEEEKEEIMRDMQGATTKIENERERQAEIVKRMKEKKKRKQQEKVVLANELLELANEMEQAVKKDKERQEERLKKRLEEKKKKKKEKGEDDGGEDGDKAEGGDEEKKKKKKKKKDKDKDKEEGEEGGAEGGEGKKKKKKKKDKDKDKPQEAEA